MSILKMFDLDADNYNIIAEDPTAFEKKRDTVNLVVGKEVSYNASIAGKQIPAYVTLESARLTRLSLLDQQTANGDQYWLATGIFNPVKLKIELLIDGNRFNKYPGIAHQTIVKGDGKYYSIAAASVLVNAMQSEPSAKDQGRPGFGSNGFVAQNTF